MSQYSTLTEFRTCLVASLEQLREAISQGRYTPEQIQSGLKEYRLSFGMIDAMTAGERINPLPAMTGSRIHRVAQGAGASDQDVLRLLIAFAQYQELVAREKFFSKRIAKGA